MYRHGKIKRMAYAAVIGAAYAAVIGAAYAALTMVLAPISFGPIQMRVSEVLCVLPFFMPCATWGLFIGCMIANLISAAGVWDVVFGSLATLGSCLCIQALGQRGKKVSSWPHIILAMLMPVVWNAFIVVGMLTWSLTETRVFQFGKQFWIFAAEVGLGELIVMLVLGIPLLKLLEHSEWFQARTDEA